MPNPHAVTSVSLSSLAARLQDRLTQALPGHEAHLTMAPRYPERRNDVSVNGRDCREAGVLVLLLPDDETAAVVLTVRRDHLPDHGGQISFPGGQREGDESLTQTALREAEEEINLSPPSVKMLGRLTPLYIPPSNFCVHPFVGVVEETPALHPTDCEVKRVLRIPLPHLLDPDTRTVEPWTLHDTEIDVPYYSVSGHTIWGATAMMLAEFLAVVRDVFPEHSD